MSESHLAPPVETAGGTTDRGDLALALTGGGARGAYQVGFIRYLAKAYPELNIPILTGVSAGAINVALLAQHHGTLPQAAEEMAQLWMELTPERIFRV
ncbi:MAG TPA: patatin-like phospholipase family protein, partial [Longimicrobium sp.]